MEKKEPTYTWRPSIVLYSQLTLYAKWTYNVHNDKTEYIKNIGIPKFENT